MSEKHPWILATESFLEELAVLQDEVAPEHREAVRDALWALARRYELSLPTNVQSPHRKQIAHKFLMELYRAQEQEEAA